MNWEQSTPGWPLIAAEDIPPELLQGLERFSKGATLTKIRLRWRPHGNNAANGFLTKDRLLNISERSCVEVALAVASHAAHLYEQGECERRFEAQLQRVFDHPPPGSKSREWRSLTFHIGNAGQVEDQYPPEVLGIELDDDDDDDDDDDGDELDDDLDDDGDDDLVELFGEPAPRPIPVRHERPSAPPRSSRPRPQPRAPRGRTRSAAPALDCKQYEDFVALSRSDPNAFAMMVIQQSHDQTVGVLTDLLYHSTERVDTILATQVSGSRYLNEALNTITHGAGRIAELGVSLFEEGLQSRARVAQEERETVLGRERNEITRDAIKQGSLLVQTIVMANAAKRNQQEREQAQRTADAQPSRATPPRARVVDAEVVDRSAPEPAANDTSPPAAAADPSTNKSALELDIEVKTERFLDLLQHEPLDELRAVAPTLSAFFDRLGDGPVDGARVLKLIAEAEETVEREELMKVHTLVSGDLASAFANLMMRAMSES